MPVFWILVVLLILIIFFLLFPAFGKIGDAIAKHLHLDESDVKKMRKVRILNDEL